LNLELAQGYVKVMCHVYYNPVPFQLVVSNGPMIGLITHETQWSAINNDDTCAGVAEVSHRCPWCPSTHLVQVGQDFRTHISRSGYGFPVHIYTSWLVQNVKHDHFCVYCADCGFSSKWYLSDSGDNYNGEGKIVLAKMVTECNYDSAWRFILVNGGYQIQSVKTGRYFVWIGKTTKSALRGECTYKFPAMSAKHGDRVWQMAGNSSAVLPFLASIPELPVLESQSRPDRSTLPAWPTPTPKTTSEAQRAVPTKTTSEAQRPVPELSFAQTGVFPSIVTILAQCFLFSEAHLRRV